MNDFEKFPSVALMTGTASIAIAFWLAGLYPLAAFAADLTLLMVICHLK
jgi:hypothetical protein